MNKLGWGGHARYQMTTRDMILELQRDVDVLKTCHDRMPMPYQELGYYSQMTDSLKGGTARDLWDAHNILQQAIRNWIVVIEQHQDRQEHR